MNIREILLTRSIRLVEVPTEKQQLRPLLPVVRAFQDRYHFLQIPTTVAEYNFQTGVTFLHGMFRDIIIDKVQLYERGMICETKADSDTCDQIIDDMLEWAINSLKLPIIVNPRLARAYFSQLEVQTEVDLGMALPMFHPIGQSISDCLKSYGHEFAPYVVASLKMHVDPTLTAALAPIEFTFERRGGQPYMLSVYHSAAALRTADHIKILNRLEQVLAANQATHLL